MKKTINKMKRQSTVWQKIFAINPKCAKELIHLNMKKKPDYKMGREVLNRHFPKKDIQMANRHIKGCSASRIIREMQIKISPHMCQNGCYQKDNK